MLKHEGVLHILQVFNVLSILMLISSLFLPKVRVITILGGLVSLGMVLLIYIFNWRENASIWLYERIHPLISKLPIREEVLNNMK